MLRRGCIEHDTCFPPNRTLVFIGDSLTRYQYLDLVYSLHFGNHDFARRNKQNPLSAPSFRTWLDFLNHTTSALRPNEACDCYRAGRSVTFRPDRISENRLYSSSGCDDGDANASSCGTSSTRIAFFNAFGSAPISGHFPLRGSIWNWTPESPVLSASSWNQSLWQHQHWEDFISTVVTRLRATAVVLNAGFHQADGLDLERIRQASAAAAECVVWKTATPARPDEAGKSAESRRVAALELRARQAFARDIVFETGPLLQRQLNWSEHLYTDSFHFAPASNAYHLLNKGLLRALEERCGAW